MLPEIVNYIFTYCQGPTNQIMKEFIRNIQSYGEITTENMLYILEMNKEYGFINYNNIRFNVAYYYKCLHCKGYLTTHEYKYKHGLCKSCKILNILFNSI
jgi:Zn finger protein HypA/HybF involved in hydrogenase expression